MKNFEAKYPTNGTSALKPEFKHVVAAKDNIIVFPGQGSFSNASHASFSDSEESFISDSLAFSSSANLGNVRMLDVLRYGSLQGSSYDRVKPWQAALVGALLFIISVGSLFISL